MAVQDQHPRSTLARKPERWNWAGMCLSCGEFGCMKLGCMAYWEASVWVVCPGCEGSEHMLADDRGPCGCTGGMVEGAFVTLGGPLGRLVEFY